MMKTLLESWNRYLGDTVSIKFPDTIPTNLLLLGDKDPEISGSVYPEDGNKVRGGIYKGDKLVGFFTPREERRGLGWRVAWRADHY